MKRKPGSTHSKATHEKSEREMRNDGTGGRVVGIERTRGRSDQGWAGVLDVSRVGRGKGRGVGYEVLSMFGVASWCGAD
jgi:hypothetical protein